MYLLYLLWRDLYEHLCEHIFVRTPFYDHSIYEHILRWRSIRASGGTRDACRNGVRKGVREGVHKVYRIIYEHEIYEREIYRNIYMAIDGSWHKYIEIYLNHHICNSFKYILFILWANHFHPLCINVFVIEIAE